MSVITKKICLLGDFNVGKTSLIRRFVEDKFSDQYLSTLGVKVSRKSVNITPNITTDSDVNQLNLLIWDLEGSTKFKSITPSYLRGASAAVIVADLTRSNTLSNLTEHINLFLGVNPQGIIIVALNKADLVAQEKLKKLVENHSNYGLEQVVSTYTTSAKTGVKVAQMFHQLSSTISLAK